MFRELEGRLDPATHGAKAVHLHALIEHGFAVPRGWAVSAEALAALSRGERLPTPDLDPDRSYAVRSSATVEDGDLRSFAGQFSTLLDIPGTPQAIADALRAVAASAGEEGVAAYARDAGLDPADIRMAAIVQDQVAAVASGIAFSRNPVTGFEEVVIEAVAGAGEALAGHGATPSRWIDRYGTLTLRPGDADDAMPAPIDDDLALAIGRDVRRIAALAGAPVDVEWAYDGERVWWLQYRPVTGLGDLPVYSNRISREVFPGMIRPFVWTLNTHFVNRAWHRLITRAIGRNAIDPDTLARPFGFRAYFDMSVFGEVFASFGMPRQSIEMLLGLPTGEDRPKMRPPMRALAKFPRLLALVGTFLRFPRTVPGALARLDRRIAAVADGDPADLDDAALVARLDAQSAVLEGYAWLNILGPFAQIGWTNALRRSLTRAGVDGALASTAGAEDPTRLAVDPTVALRGLAALVDDLGDGARGVARAHRPDAIDDPRWTAAWTGFLERFGHLSEKPNDCSTPSWREEPDIPVALLLGLAPEASTSAPAAAIPPKARRAWRRAARARVQRETIGFGYARAYARFRPVVLALGDRLVARGALATRDDVFFLEVEELRGVARGEPIDARTTAADRRAAFEGLRDVEMPETIVGDDFVPRRPDDAAEILRGVGTSPGRRVGSVRVVRTLREGSALQEGEVLVLPASDVTWTPLFSRALAVVTESGGMLAHASIVARELGIPCVASAPGATRLTDGTRVLVDGFAGEVVVDPASPAS
ncbi:MAG: PEP/pyruvate-binding domain-containing protein [Actinomycetota bacterium]